jgi:hypothetical protein
MLHSLLVVCLATFTVPIAARQTHYHINGLAYLGPDGKLALPSTWPRIFILFMAAFMAMYTPLVQYLNATVGPQFDPPISFSVSPALRPEEVTYYAEAGSGKTAVPNAERERLLITLAQLT